MNHTLYLSIHKDPCTFNPQKCADVISSTVIFFLFKGLTRIEANGKIVLDLADSVQTSHEDKVYTFRLGRHYWSDGTAITAHDFEYSWKRALYPEFPLRSSDFFYPIKHAEKAKKGLVDVGTVGIHSKDDQTLVIELERACSYFLELTSFCVLFPIFQEKSVFSGPFLLQKYDPGKQILLQKNDFCRSERKTRLRYIDIQIISDEKKAFSSYQKGKLDWIGEPLSPFPVNYLPALLEEKKVKPVGGIISCTFNALSNSCHNKEVRKALASAIDHQSMLKNVLFHNILPTSSFLFPVLESSSFFNPSLARKLFDKVRSQVPSNLTISFQSSDINWRLVRFLKSSWKRILGIDVRFDPLSFKELYEKFSKKDFQIAIRRWFFQFIDPINILELFETRDSLKNISGWEHLQYRSTLQRYRKAKEPVVKQKLLGKAQGILEREVPSVALCYYQYSYLQKPYLKNLAISPIGRIYFDQAFIDEKEKKNIQLPFEGIN